MSIPNPHELVPLELAARSIQERAYPERSLFAFPEEHLNGIAYTVSALVPLYALNGTGEVLDNRQCLEALAVTASAVETVVRSILAAKAP